MILVVGTVELPSGGLEKLLPAAATVIGETRNEDGCIRYAYARDILNPDLMHVSEAWRDLDALIAHSKTEHMKIWGAAVGEVGVIKRDLKRYDTDEGIAI
ncbi:MAG: putative quinol monooxygenase [Pontixanthobacter sp.]